MAKVVIYARVSTATQDYDRQLVELREYARKMEYDVVAEFTEKVSGAKKVEERAQMMELLSFVEVNKVDKVLIYECSRLSRRAVDFLTIIEHLTVMKVSVYILQNGLETLLPNGQPNPIAQLVMGILAPKFLTDSCTTWRLLLRSNARQSLATSPPYQRRVWVDCKYEPFEADPRK